MQIRCAILEDSMAIHRLNEMELHYHFSIEQMKACLQRILKDNRYGLFVAECDGSVIGYVQCEEVDSAIGMRIGCVLALAVSQTFHRRGIGKHLLQEVERWAKQRGISEIRLNSGAERQEAHQFYQATGYTLIKFQAAFRKEID